ncbi:MAG: putative transcriptional regulator, MarR family [Microbacteriaceae bacterium]|jgi:DNA-binding transcriptional regulator LsrR (DeoR family)|nr:putative transcriptional regulator, MarR family [Microbacteriaceae bacterium]
MPVEKHPAQHPGRRAFDRANQIRLADVARAYYIDGRSKVEIAGDLSLSRFQVAKMLDDARRLGVVSIEIRDPRNRLSGLDEELGSLLGLQVQVVQVTDRGDRDNSERVGIAVMDLIKGLVKPEMTVGISWSRALDSAARFVPDLPACNIVQLAGALGGYGPGLIPRMMAHFAENPAIHTYPISAPLVVDEPATARDLMRQPEIAEALSMADRLDLAVVAIGAWKEDESTVWEKVSSRDRDAGAAAGAVAEISGRLVGSDGTAVHTDLDARTIGVTLDQLAAATEVIAVARGAGRLEAVQAAIKAELITVLVLDSPLAVALLESMKPRVTHG